MMRLIGVLVLLAALVAGIGYYRGWFSAGSTDVDGQRTVTVTVDKDKVAQDKAAAEQKVKDLEHQH